jgi:hypothetical protein
MGLGILEDRKLEHVPGTALVLDGDKRREVEQDAARNRNLKYDKTGKILLVPQPSDDPNDPLVCFTQPQHFGSMRLDR